MLQSCRITGTSRGQADGACGHDDPAGASRRWLRTMIPKTRQAVEA